MCVPQSNVTAQFKRYGQLNPSTICCAVYTGRKEQIGSCLKACRNSDLLRWLFKSLASRPQITLLQPHCEDTISWPSPNISSVQTYLWPLCPLFSCVIILLCMYCNKANYLKKQNEKRKLGTLPNQQGISDCPSELSFFSVAVLWKRMWCPASGSKWRLCERESWKTE